MKKIVVFSNMYPSNTHPTFGIFVKNQVEQLKSIELDIEVIAIKDPVKGKLKLIFKYLSWFIRSLVYLLINHKKISLSHAHYAFPTGLITLLAKKTLHIPYIVTVHGGDIDKMAAKSQWIFKMTQKILRNAEIVIVVGEKLKEDIITRFKVPAKNVRMMSMGVNTEIFKPLAREVALKELGMPGKRPYILYVGNVIESKGLLELIDALKLLQDSTTDVPELVIIGSGKDEEFVEKLHSKIKNSGNGNVYFYEPVSQVELAKWLAAAEVFVLPSHHEGFGLAALEAMAVGTPIVASDVGGLSYLLDDGTGVLVQPQNASSLAAGIQKALDAKTEIGNREASKRKVDENSFETIIKKLNSIYNVVGRKR